MLNIGCIKWNDNLNQILYCSCLFVLVCDQANQHNLENAGNGFQNVEKRRKAMYKSLVYSVTAHGTKTAVFIHSCTHERLDLHQRDNTKVAQHYAFTNTCHSLHSTYVHSIRFAIKRPENKQPPKNNVHLMPPPTKTTPSLPAPKNRYAWSRTDSSQSWSCL